jgi:hypothetical protein
VSGTLPSPGPITPSRSKGSESEEEDDDDDDDEDYFDDGNRAKRTKQAHDDDSDHAAPTPRKSPAISAVVLKVHGKLLKARGPKDLFNAGDEHYDEMVKQRTSRLVTTGASPTTHGAVHSSLKRKRDHKKLHAQKQLVCM